MKKADLLVLDVIKNEFRKVECATLDDFYRELDAEAFDIARRNVGGKAFDIFVDDVGLFKDRPIVSAIDNGLKPMLVGNLIFANHDEEGNTTSLSSEDVARILNSSVVIATANYPEGHLAVLCEY